MATVDPNPTPNQRTGDETLMTRVRAGDQAAFRDLYDRYVALAYSVARRALSDPQAQEECTQDVFVQVWRDASRYDPARGSVGAWIVLLARSRAIDHARRSTRRDIPHDTIELAGVEPDHATTITSIDEACALAEAMATLPPDQFDALRLAYFDGLSHTEIAGRLGVPLGTVKGRVRLALDRLRIVAEQYAFGTDPA